MIRNVWMHDTPGNKFGIYRAGVDPGFRYIRGFVWCEGVGLKGGSHTSCTGKIKSDKSIFKFNILNCDGGRGGGVHHTT